MVTRRGTNEREAEVEVVDRKTRVLLFASGPMRDYQFLRNQLHTATNRWLSTSCCKPLRPESPKMQIQSSTTSRVRPRNCTTTIASWPSIPTGRNSTRPRSNSSKKWISEEAGGLIAVAGPIQTPRWIRSTEHAKLRDLYPVEFQHRITLMDDANTAARILGRSRSNAPAREAKFLWLGKTAEESEAGLGQLPGRLWLLRCEGEKPGAPPSMPISPIPKLAVPSAPSTSPASSTAPVRSLLRRQRRTVAAARERPSLFRSPLHQTDPPCEPRPHPPRLLARLAAGRSATDTSLASLSSYEPACLTRSTSR